MNIKTRQTDWIILFFILTAATPHIAADNTLPVVRSRTMNINYQINIGPVHLSRVELWYSHETREKTAEPWQLYNYDLDKISPIRFVAPGEGVFRFLIVAVDQRGQTSCRTDGGGMDVANISAEVKAQQTVFIDYTPPQLFLKSPRGEVANIQNEIRGKAESYYIRGSLYRQRREWSKAAQAYSKALAIDEQYIEARLRLGDVFYNMNQFDHARQQFELCLRLRDDSQAALFGLAQSRMALKQFEQAKASLEKLLKADNQDAQAWLMHGDAAQQLGRKDIAIGSWQQAGRIGSPMISRTAQERIDNFYP